MSLYAGIISGVNQTCYGRSGQTFYNVESPSGGTNIQWEYCVEPFVSWYYGDAPYNELNYTHKTPITETTRFRRMYDTEQSNNIDVSVTPTVGTPIAITISGDEPTTEILDDITTTTYSSIASNHTSLVWSLSNSDAGVINESTGVMLWTKGFYGTVDIQVYANGCNGPSVTTKRTVNIQKTSREGLTFLNNKVTFNNSKLTFKNL